MAEDSVAYSVPTHLRQREPFAFGRTVSELAKLVAIGFIAARLLLSAELPAGFRFASAAVVVVTGGAWALLRIQGYPLEAWLGLAFRFGASPRRRVWRPSRPTPLPDGDPAAGRGAGWYELQHVRIRWTASPQGIDD